MISPKMEITIKGECMRIGEMRYPNRRVAYLIANECGEPFMKLTVNLPNEKLNPGEFFVKTYGENEPYIAEILGSGLFIDTGMRVDCGWNSHAAIWKLAERGEAIA